MMSNSSNNVNNDAKQWKKCLWTAVYHYRLCEIKQILQWPVVKVELPSVHSWHDDADPLHESAYRGYTDIILELVKAGAQINSYWKSDVYYSTPLHWALYNDKKEVVRVLLENGADPDIRGYNGFCAGKEWNGTAWDYLKNREDPQLENLFKESRNKFCLARKNEESRKQEEEEQQEEEPPPVPMPEHQRIARRDSPFPFIINMDHINSIKRIQVEERLRKAVEIEHKIKDAQINMEKYAELLEQEKEKLRQLLRDPDFKSPTEVNLLWRELNEMNRGRNSSSSSSNHSGHHHINQNHHRKNNNGHERKRNKRK